MGPAFVLGVKFHTVAKFDFFFVNSMTFLKKKEFIKNLEKIARFFTWPKK